MTWEIDAEVPQIIQHITTAALTSRPFGALDLATARLLLGVMSLEARSVVLPHSKEEWSADAVAALREAWTRVDDAVLDSREDPRPWLFRLGPMLCTQRRGLKDREKIAGMARAALGRIERELQIDPGAKQNYSINFLLAYFDANAHCGYITEQEIEVVMVHVCENEVFDEETEQRR